MKASHWLRIPAIARIGLLVLLGLGGCVQGALALTPESPKVKKAIEKAVAFLESDEAKDDRVGAKALVGLVLLKSEADVQHPRITQAITAIQDNVKGRQPADIKLDIYSTGLAVVFLATLSPSKYSSEISNLLESLKLRQKVHGGWGYPEKQTGDTSMTQYGVLSAWEAKQVGFNASKSSMESVAIWLLATQDPSGAYGYQGTIAKSTTLVKQTDVRHSMAAAGLGSLYICADLLGLVQRAEKRNDDLPPALKEVKEEQPQDAPKPDTTVDPRRIKAALLRGNRWMAMHYETHPKDWTFYYLYAMERYYSFRELADGKSDKEPKWYTDGAQYLIRTQEENGSWEVKGQAGTTADTAFATLFLLRSSKKSIEKAGGFGNSTAVVGRGLPKETAEVLVARGRVMPAPEWNSAETLLPILEKSEAATFEKAIAALAQLPPKEADILATKHADVLRRLAADEWPQARIAAVCAIGNSSNLDQVPTLIYALGDPDMAVAYEASDALRRLTRSPGNAPLTRHLTESRRSEEIRHWKNWYLAIRPEAVFDD